MFNPKYNVSSGADFMFRGIGADEGELKEAEDEFSELVTRE